MSTLQDQLILHEGLRLRPYKCTAGKWTIGVGRNLEGNPLTPAEKEKLFSNSQLTNEQVLKNMQTNGITRDQALYLLENDIATAKRDAQVLLGVADFDKLSEPRKFVLIDMAFNMGRSVLSQFRNTLALIRAGSYRQASENMLKSAWARQVKTRSTRLARMMRDNVYHDQTNV